MGALQVGRAALLNPEPLCPAWSHGTANDTSHNTAYTRYANACLSSDGTQSKMDGVNGEYKETVLF